MKTSVIMISSSIGTCTWHIGLYCKAAEVKIKIILILLPLTRPTLKNCPYPKDFIAIFHTRLFFLLLLITKRQKFHVLEGYIV